MSVSNATDSAVTRSTSRRTVICTIAAGAGVLSSLGFAPVGWGVAIVIGFALLILILRSQQVQAGSMGLTILVGVAFGLGFAGPLVWWMTFVSFGAFVVLATVQVVLIALGVVAVRAVVVLRGWPIWAACVWLGSEYVRGAFPFGGFPWGRLAYAAVDTPLEAYARLIGTPALSAVVFLVAALLAGIAERLVSFPRRVILAALVLLIVVLGEMLPTGPEGPVGSKTVALVQGNVPVLFAPWPRGEIFAMHLDETRRLADAIQAGDEPTPDLILWPENSLDFDPYSEPGAADQLQTMAARVGAPILIGAILDGPTQTTAYNAGIVWEAEGPADRYVKRRLVPFGEYLPMRSILENLVGRFAREIPRDMLGGRQPGRILAGGINIGDMICFDVAYDRVVRDTVNAGAQLLVVQTSNASFTGSAQPEQQWQISRLRAIETGRTVVVPSTNGISGVIAPTGKVVARADTQAETHLSARVLLAEGTTPGIEWGSLIQLALVAAGSLGLALNLLGSKRRRKR
ncbi:apolipoprotein N-acyltransferase [soil metagenome]